MDEATIKAMKLRDERDEPMKSFEKPGKLIYICSICWEIWCIIRINKQKENKILFITRINKQKENKIKIFGTLAVDRSLVNSSIDEATIKAMKLRDERDEVVRRTRVFKYISVEGFESCSLQKYGVELALRKNFASCGKILLVSVINSGLAFIRFEGEGAQEKALELNGTDLGGWTAIVKPAVRPLEFIPSGKTLQPSWLLVSGYDTSLPEYDIKIALLNHFSSCGEVTRVTPSFDGTATITIEGEGCVEKALELSGRDVGGMSLLVDSGGRQTEIRKSRRLYNSNDCGYMLGTFSREVAKRKRKEKKEKKEKEKEKKNKEKEMAMVMVN